LGSVAFSAQKRRTGVLSPLQERAARIVASLEEAEDFALAGGAALIVRGDIDRRTRDLDFFGLDAEAVDRLAPVAERALRESGLIVERVVDIQVSCALLSRVIRIVRKSMSPVTPGCFRLN
jgi:hypothetical protein